jgi:prepilin-type N-terminal cleavage/methylation domain-containing protein
MFYRYHCSSLNKKKLWGRLKLPPQQQGFTLVEVLTVMLILVALASITVEATSEFAFQGRYDITQDRYEKIKKAIIGDPNQVINGQPNISGFVADMGRLPNNLNELLSIGTNPSWLDTITINYCSDSTYAIQTDCVANGKAWMIVNPGLGFGWHGAYLSATNNTLPDGWGRTAQGYCNNDLSIMDSAHCPDVTAANWIATANDFNHGWYFNQISANDLTILSYGKNQIYDSAPATQYDEDYPANHQPAIIASDWSIALPATISVTVSTQTHRRTLLEITTRPTTSTDCVNYGGIWSTYCSMSDEYTQLECSNPYTWDGTNNRCSHIKMTSLVCNAVGGAWSGSACVNWAYNTSNLCFTFYYRNGAANTITPILATNQSPITENGIPQTVSFTLASTPTISIGQAAFSVNVYDVANANCTSATYPVTRQPQIVTLLPNSSLNFNW